MAPNFDVLPDKIFRSLYEANPLPILVLMPKGAAFVVAAANEAYLSRAGTSSEKIVGTVFTAAAEAGLGDAFKHALASGQRRVFGHLELLPVRSTDSSEDYVLALFKNPPPDVWDVQSPANLLQANNAHDATPDSLSSATYLQAVIDTAQTGIFLFSPVKDANGHVVDFRFRIANRALAAYVQQEPQRLIGALGSQWFPSYKTNGLFDRYSATYYTGTQARFDFHYDDDGIDVWLDIMATKVNDDVLVTFADYTPLKQLQEQMEESMAELRRSNNNLEEFAYVASHDLQEPLRKIKAFGDMLVKRYADALGAEGADLIGRMDSAAARMSNLIEDLLSFSRLSYHKTQLRPVSLNLILQDVLNDLDTAIRDSGAVVRTGSLFPCNGDESQLRQLFQNLISNALKFARKDAAPQIDITAQVVTGRESGFGFTNGELNQRYQLIRVADQGIGFEQQYAEKIFQIFQRLHGKKDYPGTGVGLSIVQKVVALHRGYIRAEGLPGKGAVFFILLPFSQEN